MALTVVRKIEQGKTDLNLNKVNIVLGMFGHELAPVPIRDNDKVSLTNSKSDNIE